MREVCDCCGFRTSVVVWSGVHGGVRRFCRVCAVLLGVVPR